jgi:general secretion pathway protein E
MDQIKGINIEKSFLDFLAEKTFIDVMAHQRVSAVRKNSVQPIDTILMELGLLEETKLADALAQFLNLKRIEPHEFPNILPDDLDIPLDFLRRSVLLPVSWDNQTVTLATARPLDDGSARSLAYFLDRKLILKIATITDLTRHIASLHIEEGASVEPQEIGDILSGDVERLRDIASEAPIIRLLNRLVTAAVDRNASDIHIELLEDHIRVRFRIDGALQISEILDRNLHLALVSRIKILARLNIAEQRLPQDGRIHLAVKGRDIDFRVSTTPTLYGENVVLRILDRKGMKLDFAALGYSAKAIEQLNRILTVPNGVILVTGPTGSGKTTTLYAALTTLNNLQSKIFTVEDPIEYNLKGINQILVRPQIGLDFASVLRSVLRQDPDIIMVGEIRDGETARIAVQASLTGHLVLSTLHTNSAASSITRLRNLGIDNFLIVSSLRAIIAQRLVRKRCQHETAAKCEKCRGTGYAGRSVVFEILEMTDEIKQAVMFGKSDTEIEILAQQRGMVTLLGSGEIMVAAGETTREEIVRVVGLNVG